MPTSPLYRHACPFCNNLEKCLCYGKVDEVDSRKLTREGKGWHRCSQGKGSFEGRRLMKWDCVAEVRVA